MEIFRHRNLALGCAVFLMSLAISYHVSSLVRIAFLAISFVILLGLVIAYFIKKKKSVLDLITKYAPLLFFIILAMSISLFAFSRQEKLKSLYDETEHEFIGEVVKIEYEKPYKTRSIVKIKELDKEKNSFLVIMESEGAELDKGNIISARATFHPLRDSTIGFNEKSTYLDDGIVSMAVSGNVKITSFGSDNLNFVQKLNFKLCSCFENNMKEESSALYSAVVLGNRANLSDAVRRDAQRVGVSHALALSGMHITIIATLLGFLFRLIFMPRIPKALLLILSIFFFVLLTGMSESAVRAGLMMALFYFFKMLGRRNDSITALFLSVTTICIVKPYMIFSVSLMLSFLALLSCLVASKFIRKIRLRRIKIKPIRFVFASVLTTLFVILFTLPIITNVFGSFSLLTPLSNLILVPIFTAVIYLGSFMLIFSPVPFVGDALFYLGERLSDFLLYLIKRLASIDGILVPIYSILQIIGVALIAIALVFLLISRRKHLKIAIGALCFSILFFSFGCVYNYIDKSSNTYISSYNYKTSDFVTIQGKNKLNLVDISEATTGVAQYTLGMVKDANATEIENYIMTDYSAKADFYFEDVSGNIKINNLYLTEPQDSEIDVYNKIIQIAENDGIKIYPLENSISISGATIDFSSDNRVERSKKRSVSFNINIGKIDFLYLGASSFEIFDYFFKESSYNADAVIFGAHGPAYKMIYNYQMPNAEKIIFYGDSKSFADEPLILEYEDKIIEEGSEPVRFKLKRKK